MAPKLTEKILLKKIKKGKSITFLCNQQLCFIKFSRLFGCILKFWHQWWPWCFKSYVCSFPRQEHSLLALAWQGCGGSGCVVESKASTSIKCDRITCLLYYLSLSLKCKLQHGRALSVLFSALITPPAQCLT